ncbi:MAG: helix-turn-helix domain-containing protein [Prevotella sp.]|nr:helix-turn-helix domain-containing protein [Prevotella sp.]
MPMFVCLFWSILLALDMNTRRHRRARWHLLGFMLTATLLYWGHFAFFNHATEILPLADTIYVTCNLAVYPLFFLYISALTCRSDRHHLSWLLLLPAVMGCLAISIIYLLMSKAETTQFIEQYLYRDRRLELEGLAIAQSFAHDVLKVFFGLLIIPTYVLGRNYILRFNHLVRGTYSNTEHKTLDDMHLLFLFFTATSVASFVVNILGRSSFVSSPWLLAIPSTLFSTLLFALGYLGFRQDFSIQDIEHDEQQVDTSDDNLSIISELKESIEKLMEEEQLFRQPNLRIVDIVQRLGTNRNYVYQAINREMGLSFNEYVNRMRIDYATLLLSQQPDRPLGEVAEQSGFTSSTSFYRNFRLYKGIGPKEYQNKLKGTP